LVRKVFLQEQKKEVLHSRTQTESAEGKLLAAYWKSLVRENSENNEKYGLHYFDKNSEGKDEYDAEEEEDDPDAFDLPSCPPSCCDTDCECDDCVRCSNSVAVDGETIASRGVAG